MTKRKYEEGWRMEKMTKQMIRRVMKDDKDDKKDDKERNGG